MSTWFTSLTSYWRDSVQSLQEWQHRNRSKHCLTVRRWYHLRASNPTLSIRRTRPGTLCWLSSWRWRLLHLLSSCACIPRLALFVNWDGRIVCHILSQILTEILTAVDTLILGYFLFIGYCVPTSLLIKAGGGVHQWDIQLKAVIPILYVSHPIILMRSWLTYVDSIRTSPRSYTASPRSSSSFQFSFNTWRSFHPFRKETWCTGALTSSSGSTWVSTSRTSSPSSSSAAHARSTGTFSSRRGIAIAQQQSTSPPGSSTPFQTFWPSSSPNESSGNSKCRWSANSAFPPSSSPDSCKLSNSPYPGSKISNCTFPSVCITSVLRLYYSVRLAQSGDVSYNLALMGFWTYAELSVGIVCACLPVSPRFFQTVGPKLSRMTGSGSSLGSRLGWSKVMRRSAKESWGSDDTVEMWQSPSGKHVKLRDEYPMSAERESKSNVWFKEDVYPSHWDLAFWLSPFVDRYFERSMNWTHEVKCIDCQTLCTVQGCPSKFEKLCCVHLRLKQRTICHKVPFSDDKEMFNCTAPWNRVASGLLVDSNKRLLYNENKADSLKAVWSRHIC